MKGREGAPFMVRLVLCRAISLLPCHCISHSCDGPGAEGGGWDGGMMLFWMEEYKGRGIEKSSDHLDSGLSYLPSRSERWGNG